jgi:hypothetical protein
MPSGRRIFVCSRVSDRPLPSTFVANRELSPSIRVSPVGVARVGGSQTARSCSLLQFLTRRFPLSHLLVCAVPNPGHVGPMLAAAQHLQSVGHRVTFYTADTFCDKVKSTGVRFVAMPGKANYDYRRPMALSEHTKLSTTDTPILDHPFCRNHTRPTPGHATDSSRDTCRSDPGGHDVTWRIPHVNGT